MNLHLKNDVAETEYAMSRKIENLSTPWNQLRDAYSSYLHQYPSRSLRRRDGCFQLVTFHVQHVIRGVVGNLEGA